MKKFLLVLLTASLAFGCASLSNMSYENCSRLVYVKINKGRPPEILDAVAKGEMAVGMTPYEAKLCWGEPSRVEKSKNGEIWIYEDTKKGGSSSLYDITVMKSKLSFTNGPSGPRTSNWILY